MIKLFYSLKARTIRIHLVIIGYLGYCVNSMIWGIQPFEETILIDKILCITYIIFILQGIFIKKSDLPKQLKWLLFLSILVFIYIHFIALR